jgi:alanine dehydrogenase
MAASTPTVTFGFPRMHKEAGERRDFLPDLAAFLAERGCEVFVEKGIGSGMGLSDEDYASRSKRIHVVDNAAAFAQDFVLTLRCPELDEFPKLKAGATLISMIHFPTRPRRIRRLLGLGVDAIGLDTIADDEGRRLVENMKAVAWNGVEAAFDALEKTAPELFQRGRPVRATVMGAGQVGKHAVEAATKHGNLERARRVTKHGGPGVEVTVLGRALTGDRAYLAERLKKTDVLVDATQRADPTTPLIDNDAVGLLPKHAVVCDLVVDPYILSVTPRTVRSIEGIPQGNLNQYVFLPEDPKWDDTVPKEVPSTHRRAAATCYSWPGVHPKECMAHYGRQLRPMLEVLLNRGGTKGLRADGEYLERALHRATLGAWSQHAATAENE